MAKEIPTWQRRLSRVLPWTTIASWVVVVVGFTLLLQRLFATAAGQSWSQAIQSSATLVLVAVTGLYVYLTFRLLKVQEQPLVAIRLATQEDAVRKLGQMLGNQPTEILVANSHFPLTQSQKPDFDFITKAAPTFLSFASEILSVAPGLPTTLGLASLDATTLLLRASTQMAKLIHANALETASLTASGKEWEWEGLRSAYLLKVRTSDDLEWDKLLKMEDATKGASSLSQLYVEATRYLALT